MANEITGKVVLKVSKGGAKVDRKESFSIDMTGESITHSTVSVSTSGELLVVSTELGSNGWCFVKNLDTTNFVTLGGHASSNHLIKVLPGECALFRAVGNVYANSDTSACMLEYVIIEL